LFRDLGLSDVRLELNSLGQPDERKAHRAALIAYFEARIEVLDDDAKRRLHSNPLRILDTKNPAMQALVEAAPKLMDFLGEASLAHLNGVRAALDAVGQPYSINTRLVRGMDYYNLTVFEWVTDRLGAQGTVCGGGRYDGLIEQLGGKPAPGIGWGLGVERVLALLDESGVAVPAVTPDVYAVVPDAAAMPVVTATLDALRQAGVTALMHAATKDGQGSFKSQFKKADASGARFALIFGADELALGEVTVKPLRDAQAAQRRQPLSQVADWAVSLLPIERTA
jgi:histidyl-tRNA synthetase